nr:alpha/beta hydrolase [Candidatus Njordarchaeota archaeon]
MPFVKVNGLKTFYEDKGKGKPLLLIHGACSGTRIWVNQLAGLSNKLRVIAIDLPGHGMTDPLNERGTIDRYADHVASFMKQIGLSKAAVGGTSMGGLVVQQLCLKHPQLVEKLIIVDSAAKIPVTKEVLDLYRNQFESTQKLLSEISFSKKTMKTNPALVRQHVQEDLKTDRKVATEDYEATGGVDFTGQLGKIRAPTLIIMGADDLMIIPAMAQFLHENIKGSELEVIPDAGHLNMIEKPDEFNKIILRFMGN